MFLFVFMIINGIGILNGELPVYDRSDALKCYSCTNITNSLTCNTVVDCKTGEHCVSGSSSVTNGRTVGGGHLCNECCGQDYCNNYLCSVFQYDVDWQSWTEWSRCSKTCGNGESQRDRQCTATAGCDGIARQTRKCFISDCQNTTWTDWSSWSACSSSCDLGMKTRTRLCNGDANFCQGHSAETDFCYQERCKDNTWSDWSSWSPCTATCNTGLKSRTRSCTKFGGFCAGHFVENDFCGRSICPGILTEPSPTTTAFNTTNVSTAITDTLSNSSASPLIYYTTTRTSLEPSTIASISTLTSGVTAPSYSSVSQSSSSTLSKNVTYAGTIIPVSMSKGVFTVPTNYSFVTTSSKGASVNSTITPITSLLSSKVAFTSTIPIMLNNSSASVEPSSSPSDLSTEIPTTPAYTLQNSSNGPSTNDIPTSIVSTTPKYSSSNITSLTFSNASTTSVIISTKEMLMTSTISSLATSSLSLSNISTAVVIPLTEVTTTAANSTLNPSTSTVPTNVTLYAVPASTIDQDSHQSSTGISTTSVWHPTSHGPTLVKCRYKPPSVYKAYLVDLTENVTTIKCYKGYRFVHNHETDRILCNTSSQTWIQPFPECIPIVQCEVDDDCLNGGSCNSMSKRCRCIEGQFGSNCDERVQVGELVVRGPDWEWLNQDGNGIGNITSLTGSRPGWVRVHWTVTGLNLEYRVGGEGKYDIMPYRNHTSGLA